MGGALPALHALGDVVGVVFDGEDEAVLFVPNSGDVLISARSQWEFLLHNRSEVPAALAPPQASGADDLRSTFLHLGVKID